MREWFQIITGDKGVRQGCVLSPVIFALVVDWVKTRVMSVKDTGIRMIHGSMEIGWDTWTLQICSVGKFLEGHEGPNRQNTKISGKEVKSMDFFVIWQSNGGSQQLRQGGKSAHREGAGKANAAFGRLDKILKKNECNIKTNFRLYDAIVVSALIYGSATWPMRVANIGKTRGTS